MRRIFNKIFISVFTAFLLLAGTPQVANAGQPINDVYAILFIMDGFNYNTFVRGVENGSAPNIKKYFIESGLNFTDAVTVFPSVSSSAYQAFVTGFQPGSAGIPHLDRFDRKDKKSVVYLTPSGFRYLDKDLTKTTIFEELEGYQTAAIYSMCRKGAVLKMPKIPIPAFWSLFASGKEEMLDAYAYRDVINAFDKPLGQIPRFTMVGLYGFDSLGHHYGADNKILDYNLEQFDQFLGRFIILLKDREIFDKTYIILAADHGMHNTPKSKFDLKNYIKKAGIKNIVLSSRGVASAQIYVESNGGWKKKPNLDELEDIIKTLLAAREIKFVIARDGEFKSHVFSKDGHGIITRQSRGGGDLYKYQVASNSNDPLELGKSDARRLINRGFYPAGKWGPLTVHHKYPDAVMGMSQIFADGRSGDIIIIAEDDRVFYNGKAATHGSIIKDDMHVPLLIRGPGVKPEKRGFVRSTDLHAMMIEWFGIRTGNGQ